MSSDNRFIGYKWLANTFGLPFNHYHESQVGRRLKQSERPDGSILDEYTTQYYPGDRIIDHIQFGLKYEGLYLGLLQNVFRRMDAAEIADFINQSPSGKYARQIGFLYEFLTGQALSGVTGLAGNYVDIADPELYIVPDGENIPKWRIRNNLPGDARFCPLVRKTDLTTYYLPVDFSMHIRESYADVDPRIFRRAVNYLYFKETKSSNEIEHERPGTKREERFVELLRHAGSVGLDYRLTETGLAECQQAITDERFNRDTFRGDQNYVGESGPYGMRPFIHLIGMPPQYVDDAMTGLHDYQQRTAGMNTIVRAATLSFAFVFIHPFDDGNGRVHRFLINDVLSSDGLLDRGVILPVSAVMVRASHHYDEILESFSVPLVKAARYDLDNDHNLTVLNPEEIEHFYRYPDLTRQVEYLFKVVDETIRVDLVDEIKAIISFDRLREKLKNIVDMPSRETELLMKLLHQNDGKLSAGKRKRHFLFLDDAEVADIEEAYHQAFSQQGEDEDDGLGPR
ncbi:MAG: Fic family protein [Methyloprofundus sp.]|nr:Fic family protein [Methyloprofundus sp.]